MQGFITRTLLLVLLVGPFGLNAAEARERAGITDEHHFEFGTIIYPSDGTPLVSYNEIPPAFMAITSKVIDASGLITLRFNGKQFLLKRDKDNGHFKPLMGFSADNEQFEFGQLKDRPSP